MRESYPFDELRSAVGVRSAYLVAHAAEQLSGGSRGALAVRPDGPGERMACTKEELRKRVEATPVASNGKAMFTAELRRDVVEYSSARCAETGESTAAVATELGLKGWTLQRWHQNERKACGGGDAAFVEVTAPRRRGRPAKVALAEAPSFEVSCPNGYEVRVPAAFEARALRELLSALEDGR